MLREQIGFKGYDAGKQVSGIKRHSAVGTMEQPQALAVTTAMNLPGWGLHPLQGALGGHWSVSVNGNWRMTFVFEGVHAVLVDYRDCH